jgi:hypothetical protein
MSYSSFLFSIVATSFLGIFLCEAATPTKAVVTAQTDEVEITFLPTHALYQRRCIREDAFVYCASLDSLSTVSIDHDNVEIEFVAVK